MISSGDRFGCLFSIVIKLDGVLLVVFKAAKHSNIKLPKVILGNLELYFDLRTPCRGKRICMS